jgi:hypothetical protein
MSWNQLRKIKQHLKLYLQMFDIKALRYPADVPTIVWFCPYLCCLSQFTLFYASDAVKRSDARRHSRTLLTLQVSLRRMFFTGSALAITSQARCRREHVRVNKAVTGPIMKMVPGFLTRRRTATFPYSLLARGLHVQNLHHCVRFCQSWTLGF